MTVPPVAAIGIALVACLFDLHGRRIPNRLTFGAALAALVAAPFSDAMSLQTITEGWLLGLLLWMPIYALGGMGAGDVKLLAAIGAWLGPVGVFQAALYTAIAGGILALAVAIAKGCVGRTFANVWLLLTHLRVVGVRPDLQLTLETSTSPRLAYAVPTLLGTVVAIWLS
jgi:prepilin peptidase CpaA